MSDTVLERLRQKRQRVAQTSEQQGVETTLEGLQAELSLYPETRRHSAIVLEKKLDQNLTQFCKEQNITVELFLEAAWIVATETPEVLEHVVNEAKQRYAARKRAGRLRRLITMLSGQG
jgi:hypothetical protein